jgi:outer membrane protein assembly factor BamB
MQLRLLAIFLFAAGCDLAQLADPEPRLTFGDSQGIDPNPSAVTWMEAHFSPDSKLIVAGGSKEDSLALWDAKTGRRLRKLLYNNESLRLIRRVTFSPDGKYVFAATDVSPIVMWDAQTGKQLRVFDDKTRMFDCVVMPDGTRLLTSNSREVRLWDLKTGRLLQKVDRRTDDNQGVMYVNRAGSHLLVNDAHLIALRALPELKYTHTSNPLPEEAELQLPKLRATMGTIFTADGKGILTCSRDGKLTELDLTTGKEKRIFDLKINNVYIIDINANGDRLLVGSQGVARVYSFPECKELLTIRGHGKVRLSPDGQTALTFTKDGRMMLWDLEKEIEKRREKE